MASQRAVLNFSLPGGRTDQHDIVGVRQPPDRGLDSGEQRNEQRTAQLRAGSFCGSGQVGVDQACMAGACEALERRARTVDRQLDRIGQGCEHVAPVGKVRFGSVSFIRQFGGVTGEGHRRVEIGGAMSGPLAVECGDFFGEEVGGPAVEHDVMGAGDQHRSAVVAFDQCGTQQRPAFEVEGRVRLGSLFTRQIGLAGALYPRDFDGKIAGNDQRRLARLDRCAHGLVPRDEGVDRLCKRRVIDPAAEFDRQGFVVGGRRFRPHLRCQEDFQLRLGQRHFQRHGCVRPNGLRCPIALEDADRLQGIERFAHRADDQVEVGIAVRGGQEARIAVDDVDALQPHVLVKQRPQPVPVCGVEHEPARIGRRTHCHAAARKLRVDPLDQTGRPACQIGLHLRTALFEEVQHRIARSERQRMAHEGAREEGRCHLRHAVVAIVPAATVECVHVLRGPCKDADRHTPADNLAVSRHVGADAEHRLHSPGVGAKTGHHLVENQRNLAFAGQTAQFAEKFEREQFRMAALHRFDDDGGDVPSIGPDPVEGLRRAIGQNDHVRDRIARNAGCDGQGACEGRLAARLHQHFVELAMIVVVEDDDLVTPADAARKPHRRHDRFRSGVAEGHPIEIDHAGDPRRHFSGKRGLRTDGEAFLHLSGHRFDNEIGRVTEGGLTISVDQIDEFVAVGIPQLRPLRSLRDDGEDHLLPFGPEPRSRARVGEITAMPGSLRLRGRHPGAVLRDEIVDEAALLIRDRVGIASRAGVERPEPFARFSRFDQRHFGQGRGGR